MKATASVLRRLRRLRHPDVVACAILVLIVLAGFAEVVVGGRTLSAAATVPGVNGPSPFTGQPPLDVEDVYRTDRGASAWQFEPWVEVTHESYARADAPLWNPYQGMGAPHAANMQSAPFDPLLLPVNLHPTPLMWDATLIGAFALAALATYAFGRVIGLQRIAALVAGAAFSLSGFFLIFSHNHFSRTYVYLPILFLAVEVVTRSRRVLPVLGLAGAVAGTLLIGMPEAAAMVLTAAGLYAVARVAGGYRDGWRPVVRPLVRHGAGFAGGAALAAPLLLLFGEYLPVAFNSHESGLHGVAADGVEALNTWVMPFLKGATWKNAVDGGFTGLRSYVGAGAAALALVAFSGGKEARRLHAPAFGLIALAFILKVYDFHVLEWVGRLPAYDVIDFRTFGAPVIAFPVAMLAGIGIHVLVRRELSTRWFIALGAAGGAGLALVSTMATNRLFLDAVSRVHLARHVGLAALSAGVVLAAVLLARRVRWVAWLAGSIVIVELLLLAPRGVYPRRADPFTAPAWLAPVHADMERHPAARVMGLEAKLFPDTAGALGLFDIRGLDGIYVDRYLEYVRTFLEPTVFDRFQGGPYSAPEEVFTRHLDNPMLDLLGVRYLITAGPKRSTALLDEVLSLTPPTAEVAEWAMDVAGDQRIVLLEVPGQEVSVPPPPAGARAFTFTYGVEGRAFDNPKADGVTMAVIGERDSTRVTLWETEYIPRQDPARPEWRRAEVALDRGPFDRLLLVTGARGTPDDDLPGWTDLEYVGPSLPSTPLRLLTRDDTSQTWVYERPSAYPRAFVAHQVHPVEGIEGARQFFLASGPTDPGGAIRPARFNPREEAVVEAHPRDVSTGLTAKGCTPAPDEQAEVVTYRAQYARIEVETRCAGLLVLSDTYYPGWRAEVNGRPAPIHPTDIALRGVFVPAGRSVVEFRYQPRRFGAGVLLAGLALAGFAGAGVAGILRRRRNPVAARRRPAVFFDRDGVLNESVVVDGVAGPPRGVEELQICDGAHEAMARLRDAGYALVVVTNQPDIARGTARLDDVEAINAALQRTLPIERVAMCVHDRADACSCRKPAPGMILDLATALDLDLDGSWLLGDRWVDIAAGAAAGVHTVLLDRSYSWEATSSGPPPPDLEPGARVNSLTEFADLVLAYPPTAS